MRSLLFAFGFAALIIVTTLFNIGQATYALSNGNVTQSVIGCFNPLLHSIIIADINETATNNALTSQGKNLVSKPFNENFTEESAIQKALVDCFVAAGHTATVMTVLHWDMGSLER